MSFQGEKVQGKGVDVDNGSGVRLLLNPSDKTAFFSTTRPTNSTPAFTGSGLDDFSVADPMPFESDVSVSYSVTIDNVAVGTYFTLGSFTGTPQVGDTVTVDSGPNAGSTGTVAYWEDPGSQRVFLVSITGTFGDGDPVSFSSGATGTCVSPDVYDSFVWSDSLGGSGNGPCGVEWPIGSPSAVIKVQFGSPNGHTSGDGWTVEVVNDAFFLLRSLTAAGFLAIGGTVGGKSGSTLLLRPTSNLLNSTGAAVKNTDPNFTGTGLNDLTLDATQYSGFIGTTVNYSVTIDGSGPPDTFEWTDGTTTVSGVAITPGSPQLLNNDVFITFASDSGHDPGDVWTFDVTKTNATGLRLNYQAREFEFGDSTDSLSETKIRIDDRARLIEMGNVNGNFNATTLVIDDVANEISASAPIVAQGGVRTAYVYDTTGIGQIYVDGSTLYDVDGNSAFGWGGRQLYDKAGLLFMSFVETNARRVYSANGAEAMTISNGQVNVGTGGGTTLRAQDGLQVVRKLAYASQVKTTGYTYDFSTDTQLQYLDTTAGAFTVNLPTAQASNLDWQVTFKRARGSTQPTIAAASGQFIDETNPSVSLNDHQAVTLAVALVNGVYGWYTLSSF